MKRLKTWQAATLAVLAILVAIWAIRSASGGGEKGAPIPSAYSGPPPVSGSPTTNKPPVPPAGFPGAPPSTGNR